MPILLNTTHSKTPTNKLNELLSEGSTSGRFCCMRWIKFQEKKTVASHMAFCIFCS
ncbi:hypothetical protein HanIR_Chr17g0886491 [Helianthus annuus]|nr:hypothetical protein HanIR_Chr17g0886491 [Helianthus annuus]